MQLMDARMTVPSDFFISWAAPIIPSKSIAGIPINADMTLLDAVLAKYLINEEKLLYKFDQSPILRLSKNIVNESGSGSYSFTPVDEENINKLLQGIPALFIMIEEYKVFGIKICHFSFQGDPAEGMVYQGKLPGEIGLGSLLKDILPLASLEYDDEDEWYYTDEGNGNLEITGWGVPLEDRPEQIITALCVI